MNSERFLRRREAAQYLRDKWGVPCAEKTLAKLAVIGGGPPFRVFGRVPLYDSETLDAWVGSKLSRQVTSTSEY